MSIIAAGRHGGSALLGRLIRIRRGLRTGSGRTSTGFSSWRVVSVSSC